jgi:hypothetical protein
MTAPTDFSKPTLGVDSHYVGVVCVLGDYLAQGRYADLDVHHYSPRSYVPTSYLDSQLMSQVPIYFGFPC